MPASLPPELAALARVDAGPLLPVTVRLDAETIAQVDALASALGRGERGRGPVMRHLVRAGLAATNTAIGEAQ
jgi:hypothetical protein